MGRTSITVSEMTAAAAELQGRGVPVTIDSLRSLLKTGSRTTIGNFLKEWRKQQGGEVKIEGLPQEFVGLMKGLYQAMELKAEQRIEAVVQKTQNEVAVLQEQLKAALAQSLSFQKEAEKQGKENKQLAEELAIFKQSLYAEQQQTLALGIQRSSLEEQLKERQTHLCELEKYLAHAQKNLEHYRSSVQQQRSEEQLAKEQEIALLSKTLGELQHKNGVLTGTTRELNGALTLLRMEQQEVKEENHLHATRIIALERDIDQGALQFKQVEENCQFMKAQLEAQTLLLEQKQDKITALEKESLLLQEKINSAEKIMHKLEDEVQGLGDDRLFLAQENAELKGQMKAFSRNNKTS